MDFARKQLEKYGWTDGKGLGKHENGISEALKPKLKRSVTGIGHDAASDFTEHWWTQLYNKAAGNVEVEEENGKTKKIKTKEDEFEITNSTWKIKRKKKESDDQDEQYKDYFVRKAVLTGGGAKTENVSGTESEDEEKETKDVFKMTDEELFAACEGRTAHKGARHGLKATGKLARIAQQEQMLLTQPQYNGYSHAKKVKKSSGDQNAEDSNENGVDNSSSIKTKKKKKIKNNSDMAESNIPSSEEEKSYRENVASDNNEEVISRKSKKSKTELNSEEECTVEVKNKKKKNKNKEISNEQNEPVKVVDDGEEATALKKKKKKVKKRD
ncbi:hypothetical protein ABMA28_011084 [Loxostege sticticalis]|uniref:G patch domain-containing protein 4 n=1 Tax=Loxostege sticticalis TaxID=481309 RepID=A0ABD0S9Z3_LOXSC